MLVPTFFYISLDNRNFKLSYIFFRKGRTSCKSEYNYGDIKRMNSVYQIGRVQCPFHIVNKVGKLDKPSGTPSTIQLLG